MPFTFSTLNIDELGYKVKRNIGKTHNIDVMQFLTFPNP